MRILLDTNIVLRIAQVSSPQHKLTVDSLLALNALGCEPCLVPQVLYEFWSAATRPLNVNGLGMSVAAATRSVEEFLRDHQLLRDERGIFGHWQSLVTGHGVLGKQTHDARLVAAMQRHGLTNLLTFNKTDFARFAMIQVYTPDDILAGQVPA